MAKTYYTVLTTYGAQLFAQAMANRQQVRITQFAVGDGNGRAVQPNSTRTSLVRQVHRANISAVSTDPRNNKQVIFELTIPENVGGFWIREMGIYDNNNRLVAYANCPDTYKPQLSEGSGKIQVVRMILLVSSSNAVTLSIDNSVIFVTRGQLTPKNITATSQNGVDETGHSHAIAHGNTTQKGIVQTTSDTGLDSEELAFNAKGAKKLAQQIAQNQQGVASLNSGKVDKTAISHSVSSTSRTTVGSSFAVKTAYDKGVEAKNAADTAQHTANAKWTAQDATTTQKGITQLADNLTTNDNSKALTAKQGKILNDKLNVLKAPIKSASVAVDLDFTDRGQIIENLSPIYRGNGRYYVSFYNSGEHHRFQHLPLGNTRGEFELTASIYGAFSFLEVYYLSLKRRFFTQVNWNNPTLKLNWSEIVNQNMAGTVYLRSYDNSNSAGGVVIIDERLDMSRDIPQRKMLSTYETRVGSNIKSIFRTHLLTDKNVEIEFSGRDANNAWRRFLTLLTKTGNVIVGHNVDNNRDRLQVNGTARASAPAVDANNDQLPTTAWVRQFAESRFAIRSLNDEDLDQINTPGLYAQGSNKNSTIERHYPVANVAGALMVRPSTYGYMQEFTTYNTNQVFIRNRRSNGSWPQNWTRVDSENRVLKTGDTMTGDLTVPYLKATGQHISVSASDSQFAGLDIIRSGRAGNWLARIEALPDKRWKFWVQNSHEIFLPARAGTVALTEEVEESKRLANNAQQTANIGVNLANGANNNANGRVSKSGDTMTGDLTVPYLKVRRNNAWVNIVSQSNPRASLDYSVHQDRVAQASVTAVDTGGHGVELQFSTTPQGHNYDTDRRQHVATIGHSGNIWAKAYGWLHDAFAKQAKHGWYPNHYQGAQTFKIPIGQGPHCMLITTMRVDVSNYPQDFWMPEAYTGWTIPVASDVGQARHSVGVEIIEGNKVRVWGRTPMSVHIQVIGFAEY